MKRIVVVFLFMLPSILFANIRINEVMQSNVNGIMDDLNEFPDSWVEIYNEDSVAFDFTGYGIGISSDFSESYGVMDSTVIPAKGHLLLYCDKEDKGLHTHFRLDVDGSNIFIFDPVGNVVDSLLVPQMLSQDVSYGRISDGNDTLSYFKNATPGSSNVGFYTDVLLKKPRFSVKGGLYNEPVVLKLSLQGKCPGDAVIRYTLNGSEPTEDSPIAPDSIFIDKTTVVRAKVFSDSALSKLSHTESYIYLGRECTMPVFSIALDSAYMWDDEIGIYTVGTYGETHPDAVSDNPDIGSMNYLFKWRRPVNVEYWDLESGDADINQTAEMCVSGGSSKDQKVKSFSVYANKRFGDKTFSYPFWHETKPDVKKCKSFMLRAAGQDMGGSYMKDGVAQIAMGRHLDVDYQEFKPCIIFINGEYWGIRNLRERSNHDYVWQNYDKLENIDLVQSEWGTAETGDLNDYYHFRDLYNNDATPYESLDSIMDVSEFCDYYILNYILCNTDFPGNINYTLWKEKVQGAKWRWILKDLDVAWGLDVRNPPTFEFLNYALRVDPFEQRWQNQEHDCRLFQKMMSFPNFKNMFIDRASVYMGTFMSPNTLVSLIDSTRDVMKYEYPYFHEIDYYDVQVPLIEEHWNVWISQMKEWIAMRVPFLYDYQSKFFSIGDTTSLTINLPSERQMYFNGVKLENNTFNGSFYSERPLYLTENANAFKYQGDSVVVDSVDILSRTNGSGWYVEYKIEDTLVKKCYKKDALYLVIPKGANNVVISADYIPELDSTVVDTLPQDTIVIDSIIPDTSVVDTLPQDTIVIDPIIPDTSVVDTLPQDTIVIDPIIPDTSVVDTLPQDTIVIEPIIPDTTQEELLDVVSLKANGSNINVYPNPATDYVVVSGVENGDYVTLTSMTGLVLVQFKAESSTVSIDLSELPNGYYILMNKYRSYKIRKER